MAKVSSTLYALFALCVCLFAVEGRPAEKNKESNEVSQLLKQLGVEIPELDNYLQETPKTSQKVHVNNNQNHHHHTTHHRRRTTHPTTSQTTKPTTATTELTLSTATPTFSTAPPTFSTAPPPPPPTPYLRLFRKRVIVVEDWDAEKEL